MMRKIMRTYFQKYAFKHPSTADFQHVVEKVTQSKWNDYFSSFVYGNQMADYSVESIHLQPIKRDGSTQYESTILIRKQGGSFGPISIFFYFADGTKTSKVWNGQEAHIQYKITNASPLVYAVVDPKNENMLDNKHINNFLLAELPEKTRTRWSVGVTKVVDGIFSALAW